MDSKEMQNGSPKYWLSIAQWQNDPEFQKMAEQEFLSSPLREEAESSGGWARREFLKLMGASMALTSFGCIRRPAQTIVPYVKRPQDVVLGVANHYASSFQDGSEGFGIVVTTREGRPLKVEGNEEHPVNRGGMSARAHAHILSLYDPDRLNGPRLNLLNEKKNNRDTIATTWANLDKAVVEQFKKGGLALLTGSVASPSTQKLMGEFKRAFSAETYIWEANNSLSDLAQSQQLSYGKAVIPRYMVQKARRIVSFGCDFLGTYLSPTEFSKQFAQGRKPDGEMNKLVVFESVLSLTGVNADERFRVRTSQIVDVMASLAAHLVHKKGLSKGVDGQLKESLQKYLNVPGQLHIAEAKWNELIDDLMAHRGDSLILYGGIQGQSALSVQGHTLANLLNTLLDNEGSTVDGTTSTVALPIGSVQDIKNLVADLNSKKVKTVVIYRTNPMYSAPTSLGLQEALKKAEMVVYVGDRNDETGMISNYVATDHHEMENWSDLEIQEGVLSIQQPTIRPMGETRGFQDSLLSWMQVAGRGPSAKTWYEYLRESWRGIYSANRGHHMAKGSFDDFWLELLQTGVMSLGTGRGGSSRNFNSSSVKLASVQKTEGYELTMYSTIGLKDGSLANVSWLQEFPDPVTKICWDNYLCMSPKDAKTEGLCDGQVVKITVNEQTLEVPVFIQPGQADGVLALAVGFGRIAAGKVGNNVGVNAFALAKASEQGLVYAGLATTLAKTKKTYPLANTQGHHTMHGRQLVVEATLDQYKHSASANIHRHKVFSIWPEHKYDKHKWGMVIDLNTCTGCSACVIACQSENNIPTVGKKYVMNGREMHWIRIDRYFVGNPEDPDVVNQPIVCMHCDNAPCETVCPVAATTHSDEGTNDMIYNRCVGTRYCANNCPYKVRRFNWFNYANKVQEPLNLAQNPEVTVRARGVMEKCTFCLHRIKSAKRVAANEQRALKEGEVKTACQQSCPTNAITFGDLNAENSEIRKLFNAENAYDLLEELNVKPAVRYRSKVRNTAELKGEHGGHHA